MTIRLEKGGAESHNLFILLMYCPAGLTSLWSGSGFGQNFKIRIRIENQVGIFRDVRLDGTNFSPTSQTLLKSVP
jgi:hypothetical protein